MLNKYIQIALCSGITLIASCNNSNTPPTSREGSVPASEAISTFELEPGFKMELLASEPLISSPVDMEIDEFGRMYVVEMPGYPLDNTHTGRIRILLDTDNDGEFDKSEIFADKLRFPNGIMRWKNGVMITDAPYVLYFEDTDNDGKSDKCDTLLTGFSLSNPHVNVNNPVYGLDNWVYLSHFGHIGTRKYEDIFGDKGEEIQYVGASDTPKLPQNANAKSVRFRPESYQLEMTSVKSQYGHSFDRWGRHFLTHNQNHIYHEAIAARYVNRNPDLLIANAGANISDHGNETEVFQITTNPDRQLFTPVGLTTSSSGITVYNGAAFNDSFNENAVFVCESVSNLVHVDFIEENGATFTAKRHNKGKEFLASTDSWSRPVNIYVGPDGAMYVLDYYRRIIEHPEWMSDEAVAAGGLSDGQDMGRIYRITKEGAGKADWIKGLKLGEESASQLVAHLANENLWWRINSQRLLVDKADLSVVPELVKMAQNEKSSLGRLHALWTLNGLNALDAELILDALKDKEAGIRENAIKLAELHLNENPALVEGLYALKNDANAKVRYQLLCTLGSVDTESASKIREDLLFRDIQDEWVQVAALSANSSQASALLNTVIAKYKPGNEAFGSLVRRLTSMLVATDKEKEVSQLLNKAVGKSALPAGLQPAILGGLEDGMRRKKPGNEKIPELQKSLTQTFFSHSDKSVRKGVLAILKVITGEKTPISDVELEKAMNIVNDKNTNEEKRVEAIRYVSLGDVSKYGDNFKLLVDTDPDPAIKSEALQAMGKMKGTAVAEYVLEKWETLTPDIREVAIETFLTDNDRVKLLLTAIDKKDIPTAAIGWRRSVQLMNNGDELLRNQARKLLTQKPGEEVLKGYQKALELKGDIEKGKMVYAQNCALCHQVRGENGINFGPDLGTVHNWLSRDLMANILDPGLSIAQGFDLWEVTLKDGEKVQGMIMSETSAAINLRIGPGNETTINRQDISLVRGLNMSLMPALTEQITPEQMADLIAYLHNSY